LLRHALADPGLETTGDSRIAGRCPKEKTIRPVPGHRRSCERAKWPNTEKPRLAG
jgi:hypothetical protein